LRKRQAATLLERVAKYNPEAILDMPGGVESILAVLRSGTANPRILAACTSVLDRIARSARGEAESVCFAGRRRRLVVEWIWIGGRRRSP